MSRRVATRIRFVGLSFASVRQVVAASCLLLAGVAAADWVGSYASSRGVFVFTRGHNAVVFGHRGRVVVAVEAAVGSADVVPANFGRVRPFVQPADDLDSPLRHLPPDTRGYWAAEPHLFGLVHTLRVPLWGQFMQPGQGARVLAVRHGLVAGGFVILSMGVMVPQWVGAARGRRRGRLGLCRACGYDLRASDGRCPECGAEAGVGRER